MFVTIAPQICPVQAAVVGVQQAPPPQVMVCPQLLVTIAPQICPLQALVLGVQQLEVPALQVIC